MFLIKSFQESNLNDRHTRPVKDGGRIKMYWFCHVCEDLNDLFDHGCLLRTGEICATT
jgi:hypothetical protein